jgi:RHS repeat-associated protein
MTAVNYLWDPVENNIVRELDDVGAVIAQYTTEPSLYGDVVSQRRNGVDSVYHYDGQGSTLALTDASGDVTDTYAYSAFGELTASAGTTVNPFQYIGQRQYYRDAETGSYDVRRRSISPIAARWISRDPLWLHFLRIYKMWGALRSPYVYAQNNPFVFFDPSGNIDECKKGDCEVRLKALGDPEFCVELLTTGKGEYKYCSNINVLAADVLQALNNAATRILLDEVEKVLLDRLLTWLGGQVAFGTFWAKVLDELIKVSEGKGSGVHEKITLRGVSLQVTVRGYKYERRDCWCGFWLFAKYHWGSWQMNSGDSLVIIDETQLEFHGGLQTTNINDVENIKMTIRDLVDKAIANERRGGGGTLLDRAQKALAADLGCVAVK